MARYNFSQANFLMGEISPKCYGRTDLANYAQAAKEVYNKVVYPQGGVGRRVGSEFVLKEYTSVHYSATKAIPASARVFPLQFSKTQFYFILLWPTSEINGSVSTSAPYGLIFDPVNNSVIQEILSPGVLNLPKVGELTTQILREMQYVQVGQTLRFTHPSICPFYISASQYPTGASYTTNWSIAPFYVNPDVALTFGTLGGEYAKNFPYSDRNANTGFTLAVSNAAVGSGRTFTSTYNLFTSNHVGAVFKLTDVASTNTGVVLVTAVTDATHATVDVIKACTDTVATANWEEGAWSNARGWPRAICYHEGRVIYGGNTFNPDTLWGTQTYDVFELMHVSFAEVGGYTTNDKPFNFTLAAKRESVIQWLLSGNLLQAGTEFDEYIITGSDPNQGLGPLNFGAQVQTSFGSAFVQPKRIQNSSVFVQSASQRLCEFVYDFDTSQYKTIDLSYYADHMITKSLKQHASFLPPAFTMIEHQEADHQITWSIDNNGGLMGMTRNRDLGVLAWHYHELGGLLATEIPKVTSIAILPSVDGASFDLYLTIQRTINAVQVTYVERIGKEFYLDTLFNSSTSIRDKMRYTDSCKLVRSGSPSTSFSGLGHLEGEEVDVVADGYYAGSFTVSSGAITLTTAATEIIAGLPYSSRVSPISPESGSQVGSSQGRIKRFDRVSLRFNRTIGAKWGRDTDHLDEINFRDPSTPLGTPTPLFTGLKEDVFPGDYDNEPTVVVQQDYPLPCSVTAITFRGVEYD